LNSKTHIRGFTLIELMVTVAVVGILSAIAYPSYQNAIIKNRRASAQAHLADIAQREQQYLIDNRSYTDSLTTLSVTTPTDVSSYLAYPVDCQSCCRMNPFTAVERLIGGCRSMRREAQCRVKRGHWVEAPIEAKHKFVEVRL